MASLARSLSTRVKKIEKPKPLKNIVPNRHSFSDREFLFQSNSEPLPDIKTPDIPIRSGGPEDTLILLDIVTSSILSKDYSNLATLTTNLVNRLKCHGSQLEEHSEGKLDTAFETIRNGAHDVVIDRQSRLNLLQLVELRASRWQISPSTASYYSSKSGHHHELQSEVYGDSGFDFSQQQLLGPGDVLKSSGKYSSPTRVLGKNYCKDEVVIRNSDSGKVMGIKGRRVHMIEELSETVISFQRVNPGAKERLVQITGPSEDKIIYAKNLIEDTIKRNASPVREVSLGAGSRDVAGSNSSINSSASDESNRINTPSVRSSTGKMDSAEYKYSVHVQNEVIHISSTNLSLLNEAFSLLDTSYAIVQEGGGPSLPSPEVPKPVEAPPEPFAPFGAGEPSHSDGDKIIENAPVTVSDKSVENKQDNNQNGGYNLQYSREFLLQCSKSRFAVTPPAILPVISAQYPAIVRQSPVAFDAVFHQKKWLTTEGRIASFTTYAEDYLDSD